MRVAFERTGERRYAVLVAVPGKPVQSMSPAPGYDDHIPHDLVHYVVEAELRLEAGVFGRAARGGGTFIATTPGGESSRERARQQRKQRRREKSLGATDESRRSDMETSERLAGLVDLAWRRRNGQQPDPSRVPPPQPLSPEDRARVERVADALDRIAPLWSELPVGGQLAFVWPGTAPTLELTAAHSARAAQPRRGP